MIFIFAPGYCKWAGMILGFVKARFVGAILGYIVGAYIDSLFVRRRPQASQQSYSPPPPPSSLQRDYEELGLSPSATDEEVQTAYRKLAMLYHPDRMAHLSEEVRHTAELKLKKLNAARDRILASRGKK